MKNMHEIRRRLAATPATQSARPVPALLLFLCALLSLSSAPIAGAQGTGLILTSKDRLRGIPLASTPFSGSELPAVVDLSSELPPPGSQGSQQSCVGWALAYALKSYQEHTEARWALTDTRGSPDPVHVFSPAFIYNQINNGRDGGCSLPDALDLLHERGAATLADMPYTDTDFSRQPSTRVAAEARRYRIDYWRQVNASDPLEVKAQLNAGYPVVIGATVDQGFLKMAPGSVWKSSQGKNVGGHAMVLVGYDDRKHAFKVLNSWGRAWGDGGYGWIDYDFFRKAVDEAFVAKDAINGPAPAAEASTTSVQTQPAPAVSPLALRITNIQHNVPDARGGLWLRLDGTVSIPPGMGRSAQIVTYFSFDAGGGQKGWPVRSTSMQFSDVNGLAATGTTVFPIPAEGVNLGWWAMIPYAALVLQAGAWMMDAGGNQVYQPWQNYLILEPVLFMDGFGVANGGVVPFFVLQ